MAHCMSNAADSTKVVLNLGKDLIVGKPHHAHTHNPLETTTAGWNAANSLHEKPSTVPVLET